eukprot:scaffold3315_cov98-Cylindrotheca_fusiformis.AAC.1
MTSSVKKVKSIYQEALEMVAGALVIYVFADIRELARDGNAAQFLSLDDLNAPLTAEQTLMIIQANQSKLEEMAINRKDVEDLLRAIMFIRAHQKKEGENANAGGIASTTTTNDQTSPASNIWNGGLTTLLSSFRKDMGTSSTSSSSFKLDLKSFKTPFKKSSQQQDQQKNDDNNKTVVMTHFVDDKAKEEIVHAIVVNPDRERVTLIFRGSATPKDFIQDAKIAQIKVSNPVYDLLMKEEEKDDDDDNETKKKKDMPDSINVHTGFYQYLFKVNKETKKTRLESILDDVKGELKKASASNNKGCFQLYVTGHSLGGALSTLFGFYAAADDELIQLSPKGVVVYSIASPFVGNWKWRFAFQELERRKRLQHLRIQNAEDMVTLMPFAVPKAGFFSPIMAVKTGAGNLYKHVGMRLQLTKPSPNNNNNNDTKQLPYNISYPVDQRMDDEEFAKDVQDVLTQGKSLMQAFKAVVTNNFSVVERYHSCTEYEERLESCKADLTNYTLDELYANKNIVADMMDPDYTPKNEGLMTTTFRALGLKKSGTSSSSGDMVESGSGKLVAPGEGG